MSATFIAVALWIVASTVADPQEFLDNSLSAAGLVAAPAVLMLFGLQFLEAVRDQAAGRNSVPVFHRMGWWLDRRGIPLVVVYVILMAAALWLLAD